MATSENKASLIGVVKEVKVSHIKRHKFHGREGGEETFYRIKVETKRKSGVNDILPVYTHDYVMPSDLKPGDKIKVKGEIRTQNYHKDGVHHVLVFLFATEAEIVGKDYDDPDMRNDVYIEGFVCKKTHLRETKSGRIITDLIVAHNRNYDKSDYIPVVCWGNNAKLAQDFNIGDIIRIDGRFQSRTYKRGDKTKSVYEVSAFVIKK